MSLKRKETKELILYVLVPCYNEEETLNYSSDKLLEKYTELVQNEKISSESRVLFIDDCSKDRTWNIIEELHNQNLVFEGIRLSHNRGHQNALFAGLSFAQPRADVTITIDADLQQDINAIDDFLEQYKDGCEIVYGIRNSRDTDTGFKKCTALIYYKLMKLLGCPIYTNAADYRLMSSKSIEALLQYSEVNLFLRGLIPELGFKTGVVHFDVRSREFGSSKYTLKKMVKLAMDGITAFSVKPIRFIFMLGMIIFFVSIIMVISTVVDYACGNTVPGWATLNCSVWFIGGIQLLAIGVIGEYLGRNYQETKKRPRYFIEDMIVGENE